MLAWWMLLPTLLAMLVALVLPGFMWLRAGGRSSLVAIGAAPAFTFGLSHAPGLCRGSRPAPQPGAAQPQQVWLAAGSRRLWAEAAP